ncbi:hypothetical protein ACWT_5669 [Actinoplanes sp. SE50]|uniref:hypothetical protein n=1 Tax=unclassified Actinoplanes TaxID=2626549 RepID=UPI00023ED2C4|nr:MULTISPECIES: hypothetical protein [unclassified Actinoplanes]AEV86686.1 hypothetical protein ACPL_5799 [Actinoplanes sp. SE50/110]ATO85084.1 hypothetical protein ACWT_5669 [Actinoplanes sp. SE50]SLM02495.1 hypothetical protein ACSP50_5745 [Actinoplanes sp. SE50/110]
MDLIADDYLQHFDRDPWADARVLIAGQGDVLRAPSDTDRPAWDRSDDDDYWDAS